MNKRMKELLAQIAGIQATAKGFMTGENKDVEKAKAELAKVAALQEEFEVEKALYEAEKAKVTDVPTADPASTKKALTEDEKIVKAFAKVIRGSKLTDEENETLKALTESVDADGGLIVPKDIQTQINEYKRTLPQLETLINVVPVSTLSGSRVFEKIATMVPLANITDDTADIDDMGAPQFETISYSIKKYAGYLPVPNDLVKDTDQNLLAYLVQWIGRKSVVTRNSLIVTLLNTLTKKSFADWKAIKKALNITLDPIFATSASIITNQDGYQYLDTLVDGQNRPLLQPDVSRPGGNILFGKPVIVVPNSVLATTGTTTKLAPMIVGNLAEAITMFERQGAQIASTNVGGTAFRKDRTEFRAIEREDVKLIDSAAVVYGTVDVTSVIA